MKKILKWILIIGGSMLVLGFGAFLYLIPPFDLLPREEFIKPYAATLDASLQEIKDPATRLLAERGRYVALAADCNGCHTPTGDQGPIWDEFLAGGMKFTGKPTGVAVTRNLTPDSETGLGGRTDEQVKRILRSGVAHDGRSLSALFMPWNHFGNLSEEDLHALVVYLRNIKPVKHWIPPFSPNSEDEAFTFYPYDYGEHERTR